MDVRIFFSKINKKKYKNSKTKLLEKLKNALNVNRAIPS